MTRAALYARVSTQDQSDHGYSLPSQLEACLRYAERNGLEVTAQLSEDCSGATSMGDREAGLKLVGMVVRREVDAVVVHSVDRLSRDIVDLLGTVRTWLRAGVQVHAGDVGRIESELDIVLIIKGWQGSDERVKIRERTMRGKRAKAKAGHVVGTREPYGYKHVRDGAGKVTTLEVYEPEAAIIRMVYRFYTEGDGEHEPMSFWAIARRLSEMRIPTPGEVRPSCRRKREPGIWSVVTVRYLVTHELYAGVWRYGMRIGTSNRLNPEEEHIRVSVPAIVDRATWEAAQVRRERNRRMSRRNRKHEYLLAGFIRCACGRSMCGFYRDDRGYYRCNEPRGRHQGLEKLRCHARTVRAEAIEEDTWDSLAGIFQDVSQLERLLRKAQAEELAAMEPKRSELATVVAMLGECERQAADTARAMVKAAGVVGQALAQQAVEVNQRHEALTRRRDELKEAIAGTRITDTAIAETVKFAADVRLGMEHADAAMKRRTFEMLGVMVTVDNGRFRVTSSIGEWEGEIRRIPSRRWQGSVVNSSCSSTSYNYNLSRMVWVVTESPCIIEQLAYTE